MAEVGLKIEISAGVATITLGRSPVNALNARILNAFADALSQLESDENVRAVIVQSAFKVFSAGMDLKEANALTVPQQNEIVGAFNRTFLKAYGFSKPLITAVDGAAIAGGLFFVLAADYRFATKRSQFGLAEIRVGADFPVGPLEVARDTLHPADSRRLMLRGKPYDTDQALAAGIIDEVVRTEDLKAKAREMALEFASLPPNTFAAIKAQLREPALTRIRDGMALRIDDNVQGWFREETPAAIRAMIGKG